jgi:hypothetical protein
VSGDCWWACRESGPGPLLDLSGECWGRGLIQPAACSSPAETPANHG